jgi:ribosome-associated protein
VKKRLKKIAGAKWTKEGAIVLKCDETRHQVRNREIVLKRLKEMIKKSLVTPKRRLATRPTLASNRRRLTAKKNRADLKSNRARISTKNIPLD